MENGTRIAIGFLLSMALAGCETISGFDISNPMPQNRVGRTVSTPTNMPQTTSAPVPVEPSYIPSAEEIIGLDGAGAEGFFGVPSLRRVEQNGEVWQYQTDACVLFLFLYTDEAGTLSPAGVRILLAHVATRTGYKSIFRAKR